ncbi:MAG: alpha-L-fucosidase [Colwellia sp.]
MFQRKFTIFFLYVFALSFTTIEVSAKEVIYDPSDLNLEARTWFQDAKFGIFIHWGVYSLMAGAGEEGIAEWVMENKKIPIKKYEKLASYFNPVAFNADEWVKTFKSAGAQYITITTKHHDGFAMYDSKVSDYNIVDKTPFGRDIIKELKEACDKHGLKLFLYYSQLDWHHPDYYPRGRTGQNYTGRLESGDWDKYIDYQNAQLEELLTNYGDIGGFWFDGWWDQKNTSYRNKWRLTETYQMIHKLQPQALVINNHHVSPHPGEDVQPFEQDLPGENEAGFNTREISADMPLEMAQTMNGSWGFNLIDDGFKSTKELIQTLVGAAGRDANFLMNTGPMPDGRIQPENIQTYKEMGEWLKAYGESIYGTRGGPISPRSWGVTTQKGDKVYVHVMDWKDQKLWLPTKGFMITKASLLKTGEPVNFKNTKEGTYLTIPKKELTEWDVVIELNVSPH